MPPRIKVVAVTTKPGVTTSCQKEVGGTPAGFR